MLRALVVDYGGVLTQQTMGAFTESYGIDADAFTLAIRQWLGAPVGARRSTHPVHAFERGEIGLADFERALAARLRGPDGRAVQAEGLLHRMFAGFRGEPVMVDVVRRTRRAGFRTALLSNSWGVDGYQRDDWDELFDAVVISGEVGLRKPEPEIYRRTAAALRVRPAECVFVDDLRVNVEGAVATGMIGIHHVTPAETIAELEALLGVDLHPPA